MIRTLLKEVKEYKTASIATPIFMILEVLFETLIPFLMASIIDKGVNTGDIHHIYKVGGIMIVAAFLGLLAGMAGGRYGAKASTGFAKNLRNAMFDRIQTYSFANIDHFSTAGLVTRLTTDVTNVQKCVSDDVTYDDESTGKYGMCDGDGICNRCKAGKYLSCGSRDSWNYFVFYYPSCNCIFPTGISEI